MISFFVHYYKHRKIFTTYYVQILYIVSNGQQQGQVVDIISIDHFKT
jgi:hypothetical protein